MNAWLCAVLIVAGVLGGAAHAQPSTEREKIRQIIVYGTDPCPRGSGDEVVVCARRPESERYRIPQTMREPEPTVENESWAEKAEALEMVGRTGIESCSPVGPGGASGCLAQLIKQAREERRAEAAKQRNVP